MNVLINLIILYVIFSLISSFVFKKKKRRLFPSLTMQQESSTPEAKEELDESQEEIIPELVDDDIEFASESLPEPPHVEPYRPVPRRRMDTPPQKKSEIRQEHSFLLPSGRNRSYLQGIVLSEVLGPPVSKRKHQRLS